MTVSWTTTQDYTSKYENSVIEADVVIMNTEASWLSHFYP